MDISLKERIKLNKFRLLEADETYNDLYAKDASMSWPGDFVGRYLLALACLYNALDDEEDKKQVLVKLEDLYAVKDEKTNKHHFFGELYNPKLINEQQLSGNGWYIRALCEYYRITKNPKYYAELQDITENFLLKVAPHYEFYPIERKFEDGSVSGHLDINLNNGFLLSSDVGCAFILLDGFVDAFSILKDDRLKNAIVKIINKFESIDYLKLRCQTHATLTCARAILRFYKLTNDKHYLDFVTSIFETYTKCGMSFDYENMNWFTRPDSWTEPCCVVDSFILCHDLYLITKESKYLVYFNKIVTNGLRTIQRHNGGAGCSTVLSKPDSVLKSIIYEAWFCCSMRFAEGMKYLSQSRLIKLDDSYLMMMPASINNDLVNIDIDLYYKNEFSIISKQDMILSIYLPKGTQILRSNVEFEIIDECIVLKIEKDKKAIVKYKLNLNKDSHRNLFGDMLLTKKVKHFENIFMIDGIEYSYILSSHKFEQDALEKLEQYL